MTLNSNEIYFIYEDKEKQEACGADQSSYFLILNLILHTLDRSNQ